MGAFVGSRDGLEELEAAALRLPGWIERGLALRVAAGGAIVLAILSLAPWRQTLAIPLTVVTRSPPRGVTTMDSGVLAAIAVRDGSSVAAGAPLAQLGDSASFAAVDRMASFAAATVAALDRGALPAEAPPFTLGGDLQPAYSALSSALAELRVQAEFGEEAEARAALRQEIRSLRDRSARLSKDIALSGSLVKIAERQFEIKSKVAERGWISQATLAEAHSDLIERELSANGKADELARLRSQIAQSESRLLQTTLQQSGAGTRLVERARRAAINLLGEIDGWRRRTIVTAPIAGRVKFPAPRHVGQPLPKGAEFAVIVPEGSQVVAIGTIPAASKAAARIGSDVKLTFPNYPPFRYGYVLGRVEAVADVATEAGYAVRVALPNGLNTTSGYPLPLRQRAEASGALSVRQGRVFTFVLGNVRTAIGMDD